MAFHPGAVFFAFKYLMIALAIDFLIVKFAIPTINMRATEYPFAVTLIILILYLVVIVITILLPIMSLIQYSAKNPESGGS